MTERALGISFFAAKPPSDVNTLADAVLSFYDAIERPPGRLVALQHDGEIPKRTFKESTFLELVRDARVSSISLGDVTDPGAVVVDCWLRPEDPENMRWESPWITITGHRLSLDAPAVRDLVTSIATIYEIAQGFVAGFRDLNHARKECSFSGAVSGFELDPETRERLGEDQMSRGQLRQRLRRLYPVTMIGPAIWAELPPMSGVEPLPAVGDVGTCKQLTAWPLPVEPRDPTFLAGTVELRRWLWPYTIQNPADAL